MKNNIHLNAKTIMVAGLSIFLAVGIFGQEKPEKQNNVQKSQVGSMVADAFFDQEKNPHPTPEELKLKNEDVSSEKVPAETIQTKVYPSAPAQSKLPPPVNYLEEAEKIQKETYPESQNQPDDYRSEIERLRRESQAKMSRQSELNNRQVQQQYDRLSELSEQERQYNLELQRQQENFQKIKEEQWKWIWLIPLFELLQMCVLFFISYKYEAAKKSVITMIAGLSIGAFLCLAFLLQLNIFPFSLILAVVGVYAYAIGKLSATIIITLLPEKTSQKLIALCGTGVFLVTLYLFLDSKTGYIGTIGALFGFAVIFIGGVIAVFRSAKDDKKDLHGSARFAEGKDFKELENGIEAGSFILAPEDPNGKHGKLILPRSLSVMHGLILGGSGTGKSRGYFMRNCSEVKNTSIVVTDPKSELWKYTSGFHQKPMRFAPTEPEASVCFNWIPLCEEARMAELCARALMTSGNTQKTDQFWIDSETAFLSAIFAHTATTHTPTPIAAYRLFTRNNPEELLQILQNSPSYFAREQAIVFSQTDPKIKGAIVPAVAARMQFMRDENIQIFTSGSIESPKFGDIRHTPTAIYWCLREQDISRLRPLTSLFFTVLLEQIAGEDFSEGVGEVPINLILDEFANIGRIPDFETTISLARGRGVALWLGIQSLSQLNQTYDNHAAQTIISNCATKVALHGLDFQTAETISKSLGEQTISHSSSSFSFSLSGGSVGSHEGKHRRPLLTPDEVMRIGENEAITRTSNKYPMRIFKGYYNEKPLTAVVRKNSATIIGGEEELEEILI